MFGSPRTLVAARLAGHEALDDPVLERVEAYHDEPATGGEQREALVERALERGELVVECDADRLEHTSRGMDAALLRPACAATSSASARVVVSGATSRARTIAAAICRARGSSP